jgi:hypothetical protein
LEKKIIDLTNEYDRYKQEHPLNIKAGNISQLADSHMLNGEDVRSNSSVEPAIFLMSMPPWYFNGVKQRNKEQKGRTVAEQEL